MGIIIKDGIQYGNQPDVSDVIRYTNQSLNDSQKATARSNVGAAAMSDVDDLKSALIDEESVTLTDLSLGESYFNEIKWAVGHVTNMENGSIESNAAYAVSNFIPNVLLYNLSPAFPVSSGTSFLSLYDENGFVGLFFEDNYRDKNGQVIAAPRWTQFRMNVYMQDFSNYASMTISSFLLPFKNKGQISIAFYKDAFIYGEDGSLVTYSSPFKASDYIYIKGQTEIWLWVVCSIDDSGYAFYNEDKECISSARYTVNNTFIQITIPKTAVYFRYSIYTTSTNFESCRLLFKDSDYPNYAQQRLTWSEGFVNFADNGYIHDYAESETVRGYYRSNAFPKESMAYLYGWNFASGVDFIMLYKNNTAVGYYTNSLYYDMANQVVSDIEYDTFYLNVYTPNNPGFNDTIQMRTVGRLSLIKTVEHTKRTVTTAQELISAVNEAVNFASEYNIYDISISDGAYDLWAVLDKTQISGSGDQLYHRGLELPDHCNLYGIGQVVLRCTIPESDNSEEHPYTLIVSTLNMHGTDNILENIHFVGNNTRYCIHDDSGVDYSFKTLIVRNCRFTHTGTESELYIPDPRCYGAGYVTGRKAYFENCIFESFGNCDKQLYIHTHAGNNNQSDIETYVNNCAFITQGKTAIHYQVPWSTSYGGKLTINNCYFAISNTVLLDGVVGSVVYGGGNSAFTFDNQNNSTIYLDDKVSYHNAGFHNSIYRGKYLGDHVTAAQWTAIQNGTFEDLFIGDYWTINGVNWIIAGFNYWINTGDVNCTTPHVVIVPDTALHNSRMNSTDTTAGGYVGSDFYTGANSNTGKADAITKVNAAFGAGHILSHRELLTNAVTGSVASSSAWYDSTVDLMNEAMVYGLNAWSSFSGYETGNGKSQLPLFRLDNSRICNRSDWWLRSVTSAAWFAGTSYDGVANFYAASVSIGIRPVFGIIG